MTYEITYEIIFGAQAGFIEMDARISRHPQSYNMEKLLFSLDSLYKHNDILN